MPPPVAPQGVGDKCQAFHDGGQPAASNCGSSDPLAWKTPPTTSAPPALAELLPLMDARPAPEPEPPPPEEEPLPPDEIARRAN